MTIEIKKLREELKMSQVEFARQFGFNLGTVRHWEQRSRYPDHAARTLLGIVARFPQIVRMVVEDRSGNAAQPN